MRRTFDELVGWVFRGQERADGVVLSTGTMLVPDLETTLEDGDVVVIEIDGVGAMSNVVQRAVASLTA
ncbi:fumarylacetoacetate hydrolase family protein [Diaminobutyricibacter sp. McL0608]|uniref:fumarylacetoacetate hydrolase family protein n=1 Tax=Leifsonia sp. McL0608 TaxID=3143537 RepID=UPI0031F2E5A4